MQAVVAKHGHHAYKQGKTIFIPGPVNCLMRPVIMFPTTHNLPNMTARLFIRD